MAEQEVENIHQVIAEAVSIAVREEMKRERRNTLGMYVILVAIFLSVAWPMNSKLYDMNAEVNKITAEFKNKVDSGEAYRNFVTKNLYNLMQKEEHRFDVEAILNPKLCHDIYRESDRFRADQLEIRYRGDN